MTSAPAGIDCGTSCSNEQAVFSEGDTVELTAAPAAGYVFAGWMGVCTGMGPCQVTITEARSVTAHFDVILAPLSFSLDFCVVDPASCQPPKKSQTLGQCVKSANKVYRKAIKSANKKVGKAKARAKKAANKRKVRAVVICRKRFG